MPCVGSPEALPFPTSVSLTAPGAEALRWGGGSEAAEKIQEVLGRRNPAHHRLIRTSAPGANHRRGRGPHPRVPSRLTRRAVCPAVAAAEMSSTQFNKGPSYGLSAEVKNRVSEGHPGPALGHPVLSDFCRVEGTARLPDVWSAVALRPGVRVALLRFWGRQSRLPELWGNSEVRDLAPPQWLGVVGSDPFPSPAPQPSPI